MGDFVDILKRRISNTGTSSFLLSWIIINWKVPVSLFFGTSDFVTRINYISNEIYPGPFSDHISVLFFKPALSAFILVFILPVLSRIIFWWSEKHESAVKFERANNLRIETEIKDLGIELSKVINQDRTSLDLVKKSVDNALNIAGNLQNQNNIDKNQTKELSKHLNEASSAVNGRLEILQRLKNLRSADLNPDMVRIEKLYKASLSGFKQFRYKLASKILPKN